MRTKGPPHRAQEDHFILQGKIHIEFHIRLVIGFFFTCFLIPPGHQSVLKLCELRLVNWVEGLRKEYITEINSE